MSDDTAGQSALADFGHTDESDADRPDAEAVAVAGGVEAAEVIDASDKRFPDADGEIDVAVTQVDYSVEYSDGEEYPVVHVFGRDGQDPLHVRVLGFEPYFYVPTSRLEARAQRPEDEFDAILDSRETDEDGEPFVSIRGEELTKLIGRTPRDVGQLRDEFEEHYEADILFPNRFLIDKDVGSGIRVPARWLDDDETTLQVHHEEVYPVDAEGELRVNTFDIEVDDRSGFPEDGEETIICLTSHDNYRDEYVVWLYEAPEFEGTVPDSLPDYDTLKDATTIAVRSFETEGAMLDAFIRYIDEETDPDVLTGWNCLPADSQISMGDGTTKKIENVEIGETVVGSAETTPTETTVTNKWKSEKEVLEFGLADGTSLRSSGDHRIMVGDDESVDWKRGEDVSVGDFVLKPRVLNVDEERVPRLADLVPRSNQRFASTERVREFKDELPYGAVSELAEEFGMEKETLYHPKTELWTPRRCAVAADRYGLSLPDAGRVYRRTGFDLDRELSEEEAYLAGLVVTDGSMSPDDGIRFYNTEKVLHEQFPEETHLEPDGKGCYKQNVLDYARMYAFNGLGIPFGDKNAVEIDLSPVFSLPEEYIANFLAGAIDGDGHVSSTVSIAVENETLGDWYVKLFKRLGVYAERRENVVRVPGASRDLDKLRDTVLPHMSHPDKTECLAALDGGESGRSENIPYALFEAETGTDEKRIGRDKHRRGINLKRHETKNDQWEEYVFVEVTAVSHVGVETTYDIETETHNFVAEDCLVHNCEDFDVPYFLDRLEEVDPDTDHDLDPDRLSRIGEVWRSGWGGPDVKGRVVFDLLYGYKRTQFTELESYRLDAVGEVELGVGKERYSGDIGDLWENDPERLLEYNVRDVELCVELDRKQEIVAFWDEVRQFVGCLLEDAPTPGDTVDVYVLHKSQGRFALPTKGQADAEEYEGGAVFDPITGVKENVTVLDLKSLYPMCMVTINASPETKAPDDYDGEVYTAPNGTEFQQEPDGIIREMVDELLTEREEKKARRNEHDPDSEAYQQFDQQQAAVKVIMNCFTPDTDVLTPEGVRNIRDLSVGDEVYSLDPDSQEMEVKQVTETHAYPDYRGELVDIETSKTDFRVTPNHRMLVRKDDKNGITEDGYSFVEVDDLYDYCNYELPHDWSMNHDDEVGDSVDLHELVQSHTDMGVTLADGGVKMAATYGTPNLQTTVNADVFIEFLAWYVAEGSTYDAKTRNYRVKIAQEDDERRRRIADLAEEFVDYYYMDERSVSFSSRLVSKLLDRLCGSGSANKRIPDLIFRGSKDQKKLFLDTLIEGDGRWEKEGESFTYSTKSERLRDDFLRLCLELGYTPHYTRDSGVWRIHVSYNTKNTLRMYRSSERTQAEDGVYCVTVADNNTLVAGRNGKLQSVGNSLYGVTGWDRFRLYDKEVGAAVTATGREVIRETEKISNSIGHDVTYGDTDSVMLEIGQVPDDDLVPAEEVPEAMREANPDATERELRERQTILETGFELESQINDGYDEFAERELNALEHRFQIEFEKLYRRFFQAGKKKRYAGHIVWKEGKYVDDIDITGFEYKRSDIAPITKRVQKDVLEMIVTGTEVDEIRQYLKTEIDAFEDGAVDLDEIGIPGGIGKRLDAYETDTAQVRGAKYANAFLGTNFQRGSKPKRLYLDKVHPDFWRRMEDEQGLDPQRSSLYGEFKADPDVICFEYADQVPDEFEIDYEKMLEKTLKGPIARVIEALGMSWDEVKSGQEQTGLGSFT
jgi:DNA polymerase I